MKVALVPINIGMQSLEQIVGLARLAESLGFESVWTFEHVMVPLQYESRYPYSQDGKMGGSADAAFLDPAVREAQCAQGLDTAHLEQLGIPSVVHLPHLVGLGVTHSDTCLMHEHAGKVDATRSHCCGSHGP